MTTPPQFARRTHRARTALEEMTRAHPRAWELADKLRLARGAAGLPAWPDWCYLPLHGAQAIADSLGLGPTAIAPIGALAAWRMTQGIYRYDPSVYAALIDTPIDGEIPSEVLQRLPEWCVYLETPGLTLGGESPVAGAWVHLDWDERGWSEVRILADSDPAPTPIPLILGEGGVRGALDRLLASARAQGGEVGAMPGGSWTPLIEHTIAPILSLAIYLASQGAEISGRRGAPANPLPKRTRRDGWRLFAADGPTVWDVGVRLGAALRAAAASEAAAGPDEPTGRTVRGHVRRAHWHTYVLGPRAEVASQRREVRWMPPIAVALGDLGDLPATIRRVD